MVGHEMSFLHHAFDQLRIIFNIIGDYKKSGRDAVFFQGIKDGGHLPVFISCVEGEVDDFFICFPHIIGIAVRKLLRGDGSGGLFARLCEAEPPVLSFRGKSGGFFCLPFQESCALSQ